MELMKEVLQQLKDSQFSEIKEYSDDGPCSICPHCLRTIYQGHIENCYVKILIDKFEVYVKEFRGGIYA